MDAAGKKIQKSPGLRNAINATGLGLVGAGAAASNLGDDYGSQSANANSPMGMGQYTGMGIQIPRSDSPSPAGPAIPKAIPVDPDPEPGFAEAYRSASPAEQKRIRQTSGSAPAASKEAPEDFLRKTMGSYDPNSALDQRKAKAINDMWASSGGNLTPNQVYANQQYKSAFDALGMKKEAIAGGISKLLGMGGSALKSWGAGAGKKQIEKMTGLASGGSTGAVGDAVEAASKSRLAGIGRENLGSKLQGAADDIDATPWIRNAINAGGLTAGGVGAYSLGSNRGERRGVGKGLTEGIGIGAQHAYQPDPGVLGRLGQLFTGTPQADMSALDAWLNENKDEVIKKILSRKP